MHTLINLLTEGFRTAWLPCSLIVLLPGVAALLAARDELTVTVFGYGAAITFVAWLRFSDRGGDWPLLAAATALLAATALFLVPTIDGRRVVSVVGGALAGGAAAELWVPAVGRTFGRVLSQLPDRPLVGGFELGLYLLGVLAPLIVLALVLRLGPDRVPVLRHRLALLGSAVLAVLAALTALGLHDAIARWLVSRSLA